MHSAAGSYKRIPLVWRRFGPLQSEAKQLAVGSTIFNHKHWSHRVSLSA